MMLVHYVRFPEGQRAPNPSLYPICGPNTWEPAKDWSIAVKGSIVTCFTCILRLHKHERYPQEYKLMVKNERS